MEKLKCSPDLFTFRGMRKVALKRAWELADEEAKAGKPMMLGDFGKFIKQGYSEVREAQERCPFPGSEDKKKE